MNCDDAVNYLYSLGHETLALKLGLKTTALLLRSLGNPQTKYPAVQIAGTNGKGSTAVVLDSICRAAGVKTGLFTSPHLSHITERIKINGENISESSFAGLATRVREHVEQLLNSETLTAPPTFFEQITAICLLAFSEQHIDLAILETGLGGRLDSTTVANAETIGITPIALDHQEYLGERLQEIAAEKAAIIRPGVTAITARQDPAVLQVIRDRCLSTGVIPLVSGCEIERSAFAADGRLQATVTTKRDQYPNLKFGLLGRHQITNTVLAIELAESLRERGFDISKEAIVRGVAEARNPGRLEIITGQLRILLDGAHNPAGARALRAYLDEFVDGPLTIVFGAMRDKRLSDMARELFPKADTLILTEPNNLRSASIETLLEYEAQVPGKRKTLTERVAQKALAKALAESPPSGLICVTGSLYLVGEIRSLLKPVAKQV